MSGVDCSGKSTQLEHLAERLRLDGYPTRVFWYRPGYSKNLDALRSLIRTLKRDALPPPGPSPQRDAAFSSPRLRAAWLTMALVDTVVELGVRLRYYLARGEIILCDRYILDGMLDLQLRFPDAVPTASIRRFLESVCPRPDLHLLLHLDWEEVQARSRLKDEPFPDSNRARATRYQAYRQLASLPTVTVIDGIEGVDAVHERILEHVEKVIDARHSPLGSPWRVKKV